MQEASTATIAGHILCRRGGGGAMTVTQTGQDPDSDLSGNPMAKTVKDEVAGPPHLQE